MKGYEQQIAHGGAVARAYEEYAKDRIDQLTLVCIDSSATLEAIRLAQAGIYELQQLITLRERLRMEIANESA